MLERSGSCRGERARERKMRFMLHLKRVPWIVTLVAAGVLPSPAQQPEDLKKQLKERSLPSSWPPSNQLKRPLSDSRIRSGPSIRESYLPNRHMTCSTKRNRRSQGFRSSWEPSSSTDISVPVMASTARADRKSRFRLLEPTRNIAWGMKRRRTENSSSSITG